MAVIGTYNAASILAFPAKPGLRQLQLDMNDTVAMQTSPFTGSQQVQAWPGADFWSANLTLPQMEADAAAEWSAFLAECRGMTNVFLMSHPLYRHPRGKIQGSVPVVAGVNPAMATTLNTRGWKPNSARLLLVGDRIQIGATPANPANPGLCRYHMVVGSAVNSDANGDATITVWPSLREATTDGEALVLNNPQGLFRLFNNKRSVLTTETRLSGIQLQIVEAR